jgi:hypothetical protein
VVFRLASVTLTDPKLPVTPPSALRKVKLSADVGMYELNGLMSIDPPRVAPPVTVSVS